MGIEPVPGFEAGLNPYLIRGQKDEYFLDFSSFQAHGQEWFFQSDADQAAYDGVVFEPMLNGFD